MLNKKYLSQSNTKKLIVPMLFPFMLASCGTQSSYQYDSLGNSSFNEISKDFIGNAIECNNQSSDLIKPCVDNFLANINDEYVKNCVIGNVTSKKTLIDNINSSNISSLELNDIDDIKKECEYYKNYVSETNSGNVSSDETPIFDSFLGATAGAFVGNYLYDALTNSSNESSSSNNTSSSGSSRGGGYVAPTKSTSSANNSYNSSDNKDKNVSAGSKTSNLDAIDKTHKKDNWNISEMKKVSETKANYNLGNSGKSWSEVQSTSVSRSTNTSTSRSNWGSSSSSSKGGSSLG